MSSNTILDAALRYADFGANIVFLHERQKRPIYGKWQREPYRKGKELERAFLDACDEHGNINIGIRLGAPSNMDGKFIHCADVDIRDVATKDAEKRATREAFEALYKVLPELENAPRVISGSRGGSRHVYFLLDRPVSKMNLARSERRIDRTDRDGETGPAWEVDLYGTGAQVVLPPSIHPNGNRYIWDTDYPELFAE